VTLIDSGLDRDGGGRSSDLGAGRSLHRRIQASSSRITGDHIGGALWLQRLRCRVFLHRSEVELNTGPVATMSSRAARAAGLEHVRLRRDRQRPIPDSHPSTAARSRRRWRALRVDTHAGHRPGTCGLPTEHAARSSAGTTCSPRAPPPGMMPDDTSPTGRVRCCALHRRSARARAPRPYRALRRTRAPVTEVGALVERRLSRMRAAHESLRGVLARTGRRRRARWRKCSTAPSRE